MVDDKETLITIIEDFTSDIEFFEKRVTEVCLALSKARNKRELSIRLLTDMLKQETELGEENGF